ncbi:MAG: hypothetical protein EH224_12285, partial [Calditrichaeota bacterium]
MKKDKGDSIDQSDDRWDELIRKGLITKFDAGHPPDMEIFLVLELHRNKVFGLTAHRIKKSFNVAFTSLENVQRYMDNMHRIGVYNFKKYRALPTSFEEYFTRLKEKFGNLDLIIDPPDDLREFM